MSFNPSSALIPGVYTLKEASDKDTFNADIGDRIPLVYGRDIYIPKIPILSHRIGISGDKKRLIHQLICLVSLGQLEGSDVGEIIEIDNSIYSHGVRIGRSDLETTDPIFLGWRSGRADQSAYSSFPTRSYSHIVSSRELNVPVALPSGVPIVSANVYWRIDNGADWQSRSLTPGQTFSIPSWSAWVSFNTLESTAYPALSTVLSQQQSVDGSVFNPDIVVKQGRTVRRLSAAGRGQPSTPFNDTKYNSKTLRNITNKREEQIGSSAESTPTVTDYDYWYIYALGVSDLFADVIFNLLSLSESRYEFIVDLPSFATANEHILDQGLFVGGAIRSDVSIFDLINRYSMLFDLVPITKDNRMGFIPHTISTPKISQLFTPINNESFSIEYLDQKDHKNTDTYATVNDWSDANYHGVVSNVVSVSSAADLSMSTTISAGELINNRSTLQSQISRIDESINSQDVEVVIISDSVSDTLEAGDFILAYSPINSVGREYIGGILGIVTAEGIRADARIYEMSHPTARIPGTLSEQSVNGTIAIASNPITNYLSVGDFITFTLSEQDEVGRANINQSVGEITEVSISTNSAGAAVATVKYVSKSWDIRNSRWVSSGRNPTIPVGTDFKIYRLYNSIEKIVLAYNEGVFTADFDLMLVPVGDSLKTCIKLPGLDLKLTSPIPAVIVDTLKVWRVSSIEQWVKNKSNIVYKIVATIYPFGTPTLVKAQAAQVEVETPSDEVAEEESLQSGRQSAYPGYSFPAGIADPLNSEIRIDDLALVDLTGTTVRAASGTISTPTIDPNPPAAINPADRPVLNAALIASRYTSAVIKINKANGEYGTGFIVSTDGTFLTNEHVANDATTAVLQNGTTSSIKWYKLDSGNDIAVGKLTLDQEFPALDIAYRSNLKIADTVHAIGHSSGNFWTLTTQTIEATGDKCTPNGTANCYRAFDGLLEAGGSGSPIFNVKGLVVGMARAIALTTGGERDYFIEMTPINNRIFNQKLWVPPVGDFDIGLPTNTAKPGYTRQDIAGMFSESVISQNTKDFRFREDPEFLAKWPKREITVSVAGIYSLTDISNFQAYISQINSVLPRGMSLSLSQIEISRSSPTPADIQFSVIPTTQFNAVTAGLELKYPSYSYVTDAAGLISAGRGVIAFDGISDEYRARLFAREIFRCLGFIAPSYRSASSLLHDGSMAEEPTINRLSVTDEQLVKLLYRTEFDAGDMGSELSTKLNKIQEI